MMKSSRGNRLSNAWCCPHCGMEIGVRLYRLDPLDPAKLVCPNEACARKFE